MKNHLQNYHHILYDEYLKKLAMVTKEKVEEVKKTKDLEEDVEQSQSSLAEASGSSHSTRKRPITMPIDRYFKKGGSVKYLPDSDFQRRADLDLVIYFVTANVAFSHIESEEFQR